ncbi:MAG: sensor domain-containing diguanylate cyclase [Deltaproteobacteria bacterium]|nr:sensor domain-containing diguanylate cyclase [Deltaproteobacteria bacterium]
MKDSQILIKKLYQTMDTLALINSVQDLDQLLGLIMKSIKEVMDAEASSLMLLDPTTNELYFSTIEGGSEKVKEIRIKADQGIAGQVCQTGKPLIVNDVSQSKFFLKTVDKFSKFKTKSMMCVPLKNRGKTIGVLQALNKHNDQKFDEDDLNLFVAFSNQVAVAIDNAKLYNMAFYDALTKAFMRRYAEAWLETEYARVQRYHTDLAVVMFDIDHFKKINDTYGHQAGDYVLRELSQLVKANIRGADVLSRMGGEEFLICMPETSLDKALQSAERVRQVIADKAFIYEGTPIPVTISLGIASFSQFPEAEWKKFLKDADLALYHSKEHGRNQVTIYSRQIKALQKAA